MPGYYWVRFTGASVEIGQWDGKFWYLAGSFDSFADAGVTVLSKRLDEP